MKRLCSFFLLFAICSTTFAQSSVAPQQDENAIYTVKVLGAGYSRKHSTRDTSVPRSGAYGVKVSDFYDTKTLDKWLDFYVSQVYRLRQDSTGTMEADYQITDKTHFEVYTPNDMEKPIAKLNVKTVDGENSCLCTVTSGGKAFKAAYDAGTQFVVRTRGY